VVQKVSEQKTSKLLYGPSTNTSRLIISGYTDINVLSLLRICIDTRRDGRISCLFFLTRFQSLSEK